MMNMVNSLIDILNYYIGDSMMNDMVYTEDEIEDYRSIKAVFYNRRQFIKRK